jgi:hypothetical protein
MARRDLRVSERGSLGALRTRLSAGVPLSHAWRASDPADVVLRVVAAAAAMRTVDSREVGERGVGGVSGEISRWLTVQSASGAWERGEVGTGDRGGGAALK